MLETLILREGVSHRLSSFTDKIESRRTNNFFLDRLITRYMIFLQKEIPIRTGVRYDTASIQYKSIIARINIFLLVTQCYASIFPFYFHAIISLLWKKGGEKSQRKNTEYCGGISSDSIVLRWNKNETTTLCPRNFARQTEQVDLNYKRNFER